MGKVIMPLFSSEVSGKLGDVVFMRRLGKNVVRVRTIPANPRTDKQMRVRNNMAALTEAWKNAGTTGSVTLIKYDPDTDTETEVTFNYLTAEEKATWKYIWEFTGENMRRLMHNQDPVRTKP